MTDTTANERRRFLTLALSVLAAAPLPSIAGAQDFWTRPRQLWLRHRYTAEEGRILFWENGEVIPDGYRALCWFLRDHHVGQATAIDPGLLNLAYGIQGWLADWRVERPLIVTRCYSTSTTNAHIEGAAQNSWHPRGRAIDFYMEGISPATLWKMAAYYRRGGVGFYPFKGHTHIDTGSVRYWAG